MPEVTCIGILVADIVGKPVDALPEKGQASRVERIELHTGGCAANTGIGLARLGVRTAVIGKVGTDGFGDFVVERLKGHGIACEGILRDAEAATSATMVLVHSDGERSFLHYSGANAGFRQSDVDMGLVERSRVAHIAGALLMPSLDGEPSAAILKQAREAGVITSFDYGVGRHRKLVRQGRLPPAVRRLFLPSFEEARLIAGGRDDPAGIARFLLNEGVKVVALKMGARGAYVRSAEGEEIWAPALRVQAVDALGAGDAFVAGFLTGVVRGWDWSDARSWRMPPRLLRDRARRNDGPAKFRGDAELS